MKAEGSKQKKEQTKIQMPGLKAPALHKNLRADGLRRPSLGGIEQEGEKEKRI
ncbi:MAG TPA: hypothetical protein VJN92_05855 [Candidatus Acidoferrum sp.]|nr:hypothetical protein [Candidatus Acidoferrum sp.]